MTKVSTIKGFADMYPPDSTLFTYMENTAREVFGRYGYNELRVPILEYTDLFRRSIGTETDVVQKEMFTFPDRKGRSLTMRPEATAGIMRSYIENNLHAKESVSKFFSCGPMFRYERPQKGRMRQFHQLDCECLGVEEPSLDAEMILMLVHFLEEIGLVDLSLELNTLGCRECRPAYRETLFAFLNALDVESLCEDCKRRLHTNPMRVLDCKVPGCKKMTDNAPIIKEHVCTGCKDHFAVVTDILDAHAVPYILNSRLVRGLDYYTRTTFEVVSNSIGSQGSVAGGGRYDGLIAQLGGQEVPGIGFACGMERLALLLEADKETRFVVRPDFYVVCLDAAATKPAMDISQALRKFGLSGEISYAAKSMKSQMRQASKLNPKCCLILGSDELQNGVVQIKNLDSGNQESLPLSDIAALAAHIGAA